MQTQFRTMTVALSRENNDGATQQKSFIENNTTWRTCSFSVIPTQANVVRDGSGETVGLQSCQLTTLRAWPTCDYSTSGLQPGRVTN